jgi:hypothetical protein
MAHFKFQEGLASTASDESDMPRQCRLCLSAQRAELERDLLDGTSTALVATAVGVSTSAVLRHRRGHMRPLLRLALAERHAPRHVADFVDSVVELMEDADAIRSAALVAGNADLVLRSGAQKLVLLRELANDLGVDSGETVAALTEARDAMLSLAQVLPRHPDALGDLLDRLRASDQCDVADAVVHAVQAARTRTSIDHQPDQPKELHA